LIPRKLKALEIRAQDKNRITPRESNVWRIGTSLGVSIMGQTGETNLSNLVSFLAIRFLAKRSPDSQSAALAKEFGGWVEICSFASGMEGKN
jgi:hypothetical protein